MTEEMFEGSVKRTPRAKHPGRQLGVSVATCIRIPPAGWVQASLDRG